MDESGGLDGWMVGLLDELGLDGWMFSDNVR